ncbi:MAG: DUF177 domain-containing protein [Clostridia bacterium]|nr:DUF177 domain-containing protein [Clostridia bacterium]
MDVLECTRNPGTSFHFELEQAIAPQDILGETVRFDIARLEGSMEADDLGNVTLEGTLRVRAHALCANCLRETWTDEEASFQETFLRDGDPEDDEIFAYSGHVIDLEKMVMSYAVLNLPMRFVCGPACPGIAEFQTADFSETSCQKETPGQRPFAALQELLGQQGEEKP